MMVLAKSKVTEFGVGGGGLYVFTSGVATQVGISPFSNREKWIFLSVVCLAQLT